MNNSINSNRVYVAPGSYNPSDLKRIVEQQSSSSSSAPQDSYTPSAGNTSFEPYYAPSPGRAPSETASPARSSGYSEGNTAFEPYFA